MAKEDRIFPLSTASIRNIVIKYREDENLGHKDLATTAVYLDLIEEDVIEEFQKVEWH